MAVLDQSGQPISRYQSGQLNSELQNDLLVQHFKPEMVIGKVQLLTSYHDMVCVCQLLKLHYVVCFLGDMLETQPQANRQILSLAVIA